MGLAVVKPEKALSFLSCLRYQIGQSVFDPLQKAHLIWCTNSCMPAVEVIYQAAGEGPLNAVLNGRTEAIYHLCYEIDDFAVALEDLKSSGRRVVCVSPQKPSVLFSGQAVGFYYIAGFGLTELVGPLA